VEAALLIDKELIPDRLFAAVNLSYEPELSRQRPAIDWERTSTLGVGAALSTRVLPGLFVGAEARYFRNYEGTGLNTFTGDTLFVGPTLFRKLSKEWFASIAWNIQVAGHVSGEPGRLVRFRLGKDLH